MSPSQEAITNYMLGADARRMSALFLDLARAASGKPPSSFAEGLRFVIARHPDAPTIPGLATAKDLLDVLAGLVAADEAAASGRCWPEEEVAEAARTLGRATREHALALDRSGLAAERIAEQARQQFYASAIPTN